MKTTTSRITLILAILSIVTLSCNLLNGGEEPDIDPQALSEEDVIPTESFEEEVSPTALPESEPAEIAAAPTPKVIMQWAKSAIASSEYGDAEYSAFQAVGPPNTPDCGDQGTAWGSLEGEGVDWLELSYRHPVIPTEVNIYESHTPSQVVLVEVIDTDGFYHEIYHAKPEMKGDCPFILSIPVSSIDYPVEGVKITVDQSKLGLPWDEIDAVELVGWREDDMGIAEVEGAPEPTAIEQPQTSTNFTISMPDSTLWRVSEEDLGIDLDTFGDIAVSAGGNIFVPVINNGIIIFDSNGTFLDRIDHEALQNPGDVKIGPDGNLYVADNFANQVLIFDQDGELLSQFGEKGNGLGQFGNFGPKALAVCPDGIIYTLDDNRDENDKPFQRLIMFNLEGEYLGEKMIDEGFPVGMECSPDGYLYVVNYFGHHLQKRDQDGNVLAEVGGAALQGMSPQYLTFDQEGFIYLTVWEEPGIVILDPAGNFLGRFGYDEAYDVTPWPDGAMNQPKGIAVMPDGSMIFFTDYANSMPFLEALEIK